MATWGSRGLRGSQLEETVNSVNEKYRDLKLALIQKIPTPITPVDIDDNRHITLAYFEKRSTVDYIGVVQGYPVCFDAKECSQDTFAMSNVHEHQYLFMRDFEQQEGIAFILLNFTKRNQYYYMRFSEIDKFYQRAKNGGPKSVKYTELDPAYFMGPKSGILVHYLDGVLLDLNERNAEAENDI
ncbi:MAG: Holliday junction resolvase RecU [Lachnospiraceae bacterium]|nr:Holliday junction resolvase RecU [Lachnospiraceae bacterium]